MGYEFELQTYIPLDEGNYPAEIARIELETGQFGQQLKFSFDLLGEHEGRTLLGWASAKFSSKSKLYAWTRAALGGQPMEPGYLLNTDDLIGRKVNLTVERESREDGSEYNKVSRIRPYQNGQAPVQPPVRQPEPVADAAGFGNF